LTKKTNVANIQVSKLKQMVPLFMLPAENVPEIAVETKEKKELVLNFGNGSSFAVKLRRESPSSAQGVKNRKQVARLGCVFTGVDNITWVMK